MPAMIRSIRAAIGREFEKPLRRSSEKRHFSAYQHLVRVALPTYLDPYGSGGHLRLNGSQGSDPETAALRRKVDF